MRKVKNPCRIKEKVFVKVLKSVFVKCKNKKFSKSICVKYENEKTKKKVFQYLWWIIQQENMKQCRFK